MANEALRLKEFKRDEKKGIVMDGSIMKWKAGTITNMLKKYAHQKEDTIPIVEGLCDGRMAGGVPVVVLLLHPFFPRPLGARLP